MEIIIIVITVIGLVSCGTNPPKLEEVSTSEEVAINNQNDINFIEEFMNAKNNE